MEEQCEVVVTIRCITYNQAQYIRETLEGFVNQKTNFRFEAVVHDDASTDGTTEIVREYAAKYPDIITPLYETENQYSKRDGSLQRILNAHMRGRYIAICEGDDYWSDPLKLQKQVDILEANSKYGAVCCQARIFNQKRGEFETNLSSAGPFTFESLLNSNDIVAPTVMMRTEEFFRYREVVGDEANKWKMSDYPRWLWFARECGIYAIPEAMVVYRVVENSASHFTDIKREIAFLDSVLAIQQFFMELYNYPKARKVRDRANRHIFRLLCANGMRKEAKERFKAIKIHKISEIIRYLKLIRA